MANALVAAKAANLAEYNPAAADLLLRLDGATSGLDILNALEEYDENSED